MATGLDVSTKEPFGGISDNGLLRSNTELHGLIRNDTPHGMCTANEERFATVQIKASMDKKGLKRIDKNP